jgi:hypothetical protein
MLYPHEGRGQVMLLYYLGHQILGRYSTGPSRDCSNRKYLRAEQIEEQVWEFVRGLLRDPERIRAGIDGLIEEERTEAGRDPERDAKFWSWKLT